MTANPNGRFSIINSPPFTQPRWKETEQQDQFCFFLEGPASEYYIDVGDYSSPEVQRNTPEVLQTIWLLCTTSDSPD